MPYKDPEKQKAYQRAWMRKRRQKWFSENGPCVKCGSWENLELDHKDPSSKATHCVWSFTKEKRNRELRKCQVLCDICHLEKTRKDLAILNGKISVSDVRAIRKRYKNGETQESISKDFPVGQRQISRIVNHKNWRVRVLENSEVS